jgi:hypothetical protein
VTDTAVQRYAAWHEFVRRATDDTIPHCDSRILHHPDDCDYCNRPDWTKARAELGIEFTGREQRPGFVPCEADVDRPAGAHNDHRRWGGNKPTSATGDPEWPVETYTSYVLYGDKGGRAPWPFTERLKRRVRRPFTYARMRLRGFRRIDGFWTYGGHK